MVTEQEIQEALELERQAEKEAENDKLEFIITEGDIHPEKKFTKQDKIIAKKEVSLSEVVGDDKEEEDDEEDLSFVELDDKKEKEQQQENQEESEDYEQHLLSVASFLNDSLNLNLAINEETINQYSPEDILNGVIRKIQQQAIEQYKEQEAENTYKTAESYYLDVFLSNGGSIEDFIEYYNRQKSNLDEIDNLLAEMKEYTPEQLLFAIYTQEGFSEEEALTYIDKLNAKGALEDEYEKEITKIEKLLAKEKENRIKESLKNIASNKEEERIREYELLENAKTEIASYLSKIDNIAGFYLDDDKKERLFSFITEQDEEGYTAYDRFLQSKENLINQALFALFGNEILRAIKTAGNEEGKKTFFSKLPSSPAINAKKAVVHQVNFDKLNDF
jgi:hypothetical protein